MSAAFASISDGTGNAAEVRASLKASRKPPKPVAVEWVENRCIPGADGSATLPVRIYAEATFSLEPTVHAVSTLMIAATILLLALVNRMVRLDRVWHR